MTGPNFQLLLPLAVTFLAPFAILLAGRRSQNLREGVSFVAAALAFLAVARFIPEVLGGAIPKQTLFHILPGLTVSVCLDGLGIIFALIATFLWFFATSYNIGYMRSLAEHAQTRYYFCFGVAIFGAVGVAMSANVFTLYLFYEIISVFTYPLVAHHEDEEGFAGAKKYLVYLMGTSKLFLLPAMALTYVLAGGLDFSLGEISRGLFLNPDGSYKTALAAQNPWLIQLAYILYIAGLAKAALMPFHNWLPSAMVAPTPVSALLHAVAVVKAGVFSVSRIILSLFGAQTMHDFGLSLPTAYLAALTIVAASCIALTKDDIKARLAYSTVSQLSYVILGVALVGAAAGDLQPQRRGRPGGPDPHRPPRLRQDNPLFRGRGHLRGHPPQGHQQNERPGPPDALDFRGLRPGFPDHDRRAAGGRLRLQVAPPGRGPGRGPDPDPGRPPGLHHLERRLLRPHLLPGLLPQARGGDRPEPLPRGPRGHGGPPGPDQPDLPGPGPPAPGLPEFRPGPDEVTGT